MTLRDYIGTASYQSIVERLIASIDFNNDEMRKVEKIVDEYLEEHHFEEESHY